MNSERASEGKIVAAAVFFGQRLKLRHGRRGRRGRRGRWLGLTARCSRRRRWWWRLPIALGVALSLATLLLRRLPAALLRRLPTALRRRLLPTAPRSSRTALVRLALQDPAGFATYAAVSLAVRFGKSAGWTRGR